MYLQKIKGGKYILFLGLAKVKIDDPKSFLEHLRSRSPRAVIQAIDARFCAGIKHLQMVSQQALASWRCGSSYLEKPDLDLLARFACNLQVKDALRSAGLKKGVKEVVIIAFGSKGTLESTSRFLEGLGKVTDSVMRPSRSRIRFLREYHRIPDELTESTLASEEDKLAFILAERAALLNARRA